MVSKVVFISDGSANAAEETALLLARNGYTIYIGYKKISQGRKLVQTAKQDNLIIKLIKMDLLKMSSVNNAINKIFQESKRIDILINTHGYILLGCFEDLSHTEIQNQFEANLYSTIRIVRRVLPIMRKGRGGIIITLGSVAGRIGLPVSSAFVSSQFALEGMCESLRYEVEPFNIYVCIIEPGVIRADNIKKFIVLSRNAAKTSSVYSKITKNLVDNIAKMIEMGTDRYEIARTILRAIQSKSPLPRYVVGNDAAMILETRKSMNDIEFGNFLKSTILNI